MSVHYTDDLVTLHHGDCLDVLRKLPDASVDSVVTDPPYELTAGKKGGTGAASLNVNSPAGRSRIGTGNSGGFMGKSWDATGIAHDPVLWAECLRVLKPGGHLLAFGGTRTWHRLAVAIEDAGFEIRDSIAWMFGSGFPKSLDVSKAIDRTLTRELTQELEFTAWMRSTGITSSEINEATGTFMGGHYLTAKSQPAIPTAAILDLLRPLLPRIPDWIEREVQARELSKAESAARNDGKNNFLSSLDRDGQRERLREDAPEVAARWQGWGTALKPAYEPIVVARKPLDGTVAANVLKHGTGALNIAACRIAGTFTSGWSKSGSRASENTSMSGPNYARDPKPDNPHGRWPANVVLDEHAAAELDQQSGTLTSGVLAAHHARAPKDAGILGAYGSAEGQRGYGDIGGASRFFYTAKAGNDERPGVDGVAHPTVKPLSLMRWLVRLVTPPGGTVLEPFAGSGTTAEACVIEGFRCVAVEREADYLPLIVARLTKPIQPDLFSGGAA